MSRGVTELLVTSRDTGSELVTADMDIDITDSEPEFLLPSGPDLFISDEEERGKVA